MGKSGKRSLTWLADACLVLAHMKMIPLISSDAAGPLGLIHLPRLWQKASLEARGLLDSAYVGNLGGGYDGMLLKAINVNTEEFLKFVTDQRPNYLETEAWVAKQPNVKLDKETVEASNAAIRGYNHKEEVRAAILQNYGVTDEQVAFRDAVNLNNLDDWYEFHAQVLR